MDEPYFADDAFLFEIEPRIQWRTRQSRLEGSDGDRKFDAPNEPAGVVIRYSLRSGLKEMDKAVLRITDLAGEAVTAIEGKTTAGLHTVVWDMRRPPAPKTAAAGGPPSEGYGRPPLVPPGEYLVTLEAAGRKITRRALLRAEPER